MRWVVIAIALVTGTAWAETPGDQVVRLVDRYRAAAGLPGVRLDSELSKGCMAHAEYMRLNRGTPAMEGLNAHQERGDLPGATPAGAACGKAADLFPGVSDLGAAVDAWMAGIYHRRPMLDPTLTTIAVGISPLPDGTLMAALMFVDDKAAHGGWPVAYPADRETDVPLAYGAEIPNPIPGGGPGGYPITLQFPPFDKVIGVTATLTAGGKTIPLHLSDPEHPATSFGQYGVVSVIPKDVLRPETTYAVRIGATWQGKHTEWSWSFTTLALRVVDAGDPAAITAALGVASRVRGTVVHGGMIDTATVFLALTSGEKLVSVVIPAAIWKQLARSAKPETYPGKHVEVEATPALVDRKFINLAIESATQLRFVHD